MIAFVIPLEYFIRLSKQAAKLQIRIDSDLKEAAEKVFSEIGMDTTTAVRMFLKRVTQTRSIPFPLRVEPAFSKEDQARILAVWDESKDPSNLSASYSDVEAMIASMRQSETE